MKNKEQNSHFLLHIFRLTSSPRQELNDNYKDVLQVKKVCMNEIVCKDYVQQSKIKIYLIQMKSGNFKIVYSKLVFSV